MPAAWSEIALRLTHAAGIYFYWYLTGLFYLADGIDSG